MARTFAASFPAFVQQPIARRIGSNLSRWLRVTRATTKRVLRQSASSFAPVILAGRRTRHDLRAPENFIRHPVADPGKPFLQQEHGFNRRAGVALNEIRPATPS